MTRIIATRAAILAAALLCVGSLARAQVIAQGPGPRVEVEVGGGLLGGADLGSRDANLRASRQAQQPFRLFTADTRFARTGMIHVRTSFALTRRFALEGGMTWGHPEIRTSVTADAENAPPLVSTERVDQYFVDGGIVITLHRFGIGARAVPFVSAGAGYLRQLHEGQAVIEEGQVYHVGGGIKYRLRARNRGVIRATGLRADVRMNVLRGGISFEENPRPQLAVSGGVFVGF